MDSREPMPKRSWNTATGKRHGLRIRDKNSSSITAIPLICSTSDRPAYCRDGINNNKTKQYVYSTGTKETKGDNRQKHQVYPGSPGIQPSGPGQGTGHFPTKRIQDRTFGFRGFGPPKGPVQGIGGHSNICVELRGL